MDYSEKSAGLRVSGNDHALEGAVDQFVVGGDGVVFGSTAGLVTAETSWLNDKIIKRFVGRFNLLGNETRLLWNLHNKRIENTIATTYAYRKKRPKARAAIDLKRDFEKLFMSTLSFLHINLWSCIHLCNALSA